MFEKMMDVVIHVVFVMSIVAAITLTINQDARNFIVGTMRSYMIANELEDDGYVVLERSENEVVATKSGVICTYDTLTQEQTFGLKLIYDIENVLKEGENR